MASTLIVGTDTYISAEDALAYINSMYLSTDSKVTSWTVLSDADKDVCLKRATQMIDRQPLLGFKVYNNQTLAFPRMVYSDYKYTNQDNILFDDEWFTQIEVPKEVKYAEVEIALELAKGPSKRTKLQQEGVTSFSVGNLSESYSGIHNKLLSLEAKELLTPFLAGSVRIC